MSGKYGPEGGIPEETEIARTHGFSRGTVNSALTLLEGEGLIVKRGRTFYVNRSSEKVTSYVHPLPHRVKGAYHENIVDPKRVTLPDEMADKLGLDRGTAAVYRYRLGVKSLRSHLRPFRLAEYYYIIPLTDDDIQRMKSEPDVDILVGKEPNLLHQHEDVFARLATDQEVALLEMPNCKSVPVLQVNITTSGQESGEPLLIQELVLFDEVFTYDFDLDNRPQEQS